MQYHEGAQDDEEPAADPGGHLADLAALHAQDPGYQEGACRAAAPPLPPLLFILWMSSVGLMRLFVQAIDHLLEKEYIERVEGTRDTFAYVA